MLLLLIIIVADILRLCVVYYSHMFEILRLISEEIKNLVTACGNHSNELRIK